MKNRSNSPTSSEDARRMTRMHQINQMESAARGTRPSYNLSTGSAVASNTTDSNASRNLVVASNFLTDEVNDNEALGRHSTTTATAAASSPQRMSAASSIRNFFMPRKSFNKLHDPADQPPRNSGSGGRLSFVDMFVGDGNDKDKDYDKMDDSSSRNDGSAVVEPMSSSRRLIGNCVIMSAVLIVATILAGSVSFLFLNPDATSIFTKPRPPTYSEMLGFEATGERQEDMKKVLLLHRAAHVDSFQDASSPAAQALQWLSETDPAQIPIDGDNEEELLSRFALASLYFATHPQVAQTNRIRDTAQVDSTVWLRADNWMSSASVCEWYGVDCDEDEQSGIRMVRHLNLTSNNLVGKLPMELRSLSNMVLLDLSYNDLKGTISNQILRLMELEYCFLNNNQLSGVIPEQIFLLEAAQEIDFSNNKLSGPIPSSISHLLKLRYLNLQFNSLSGSIPDLSGLREINYLYLNDNKLVEMLPFSISRLTTLCKFFNGLNTMVGFFFVVY